MRRNKRTIAPSKNKENCTNPKLNIATKEHTCVVHLSDGGEDECFIVKGPKEVKVFLINQIATTVVIERC
jgi:hypothetical protein